MNPVVAHKDELKKLLENLSGDTAVSGIGLVASLDAYITRLDTNCSDIRARANPLRRQRKTENYHGTSIDSELCALLRAT